MQYMFECFPVAQSITYDRSYFQLTSAQGFQEFSRLVLPKPCKSIKTDRQYKELLNEISLKLRTVVS